MHDFPLAAEPRARERRSADRQQDLSRTAHNLIITQALNCEFVGWRRAHRNARLFSVQEQAEVSISPFPFFNGAVSSCLGSADPICLSPIFARCRSLLQPPTPPSFFPFLR
jgi:hypothetical protein